MFKFALTLSGLFSTKAEEEFAPRLCNNIRGNIPGEDVIDVQVTKADGKPKIEITTWDELKKRSQAGTFFTPKFDPEIIKGDSTDVDYENSEGTNWINHALHVYNTTADPITIRVEEDDKGNWHLKADFAPVFSILGWIDGIKWDKENSINSYKLSCNCTAAPLRGKYYHDGDAHTESNEWERNIEQSSVKVIIIRNNNTKHYLD